MRRAETTDFCPPLSFFARERGAEVTMRFKNIEKWLKETAETDFTAILKRCGEEGVKALAQATPEDTGTTAAKWRYEIKRTGRGKATVYFCNDNVHDGANVAVLLQYGHGTGTGGYVQGIDYINPALKPVFETLIANMQRPAV